MSKNKKQKKIKKNNLKKLFFCIVFVALIMLIYYVYDSFIKDRNTVTAPKVVDEIKLKSINYVVNENDTKLFKDNFEELKKVLNDKKIDNKKYAETVSKLFVIDFFTLSNKTSKNDIGGVQFVYSSYKTEFVDFARDGMYKRVNNSIEDGNNSNLPTVKSVNVSNVEEIDPSAIFSNIDFGEDKVGYEVTLDWTYKNDDDYQDSTTLTIVNDGKKLSIGKMAEN